MFFLTGLQHDSKTCVLFTDTNQKTYKTKKMKKIILSAAVMLTLFSATYAKMPDNITERAAVSFHRTFRKVSEVTTTVINNHVRVSFHQDNETKYAYYDFQGNLIGVVQHILTSSLPEDLQQDFMKHYANYWVTELFQVSTDDGVYYYLQLTNADETIVLTNEGSIGWHRFMTKKATNL